MKKKHPHAHSRPSKDSRFSWLLDKSIDVLFLVIFVGVPSFMLTNTHQIFELQKMALFRSAVEILLALFAIRFLTGGKFSLPLRHPLVLGAGLWLVVIVVTTMFSTVPFTSIWGTYFRFQGLFSYLHYFALCAMLVLRLTSIPAIEKYLKMMVGGSLLVLAYGMIQKLGFDPFPWSDVAFGRRVFSTFGQPNFLGGYLAMMLPLTLYFGCKNYLSQDRPLSLRAKLSQLLLPKKTIHVRKMSDVIFFHPLFVVGVSCLQGAVLLWTQSRGALLGALASTGLFLLLYTIRFQSKTGKKILAIGLGVLMLVAIVLSVENPVREKIQTSTRLNSATYLTRLYIWQSAWVGIQDSPLFGHGPESMYATFPKYYDARIASTEGTNIIPDRAHNLFLNITYFYGFFGLTIYLFLIGSIVHSVFCAIKHQRTALVSIALLSSMVGYWVQGMFSFSVSVMLILFWSFVAMLIRISDAREKLSQQEKSSNPPVVLRGINTAWSLPIVLVALVVAYLFNFKAVQADYFFKKANEYDHYQEYALATMAFEQTVRHDPLHLLYQVYLVNAYVKQARYELHQPTQEELLARAQQTLDNLAEKQTPDVNYYIALARLRLAEAGIYADAQLYEEAHLAYEEAAKRSPQKASLFDEWGSVLMQKGDVNEAITKFEKALGLFGNKDWIQYHQYTTHLGAAYLYQGNFEKTIEVMQDVYRPGRFYFDTYEARFVSAHAYKLAGDMELALRHALHLLKHKEEDVVGNLLVAEVYFEMGNKHRAKIHAQRVLDKEPNNPIALKYI